MTAIVWWDDGITRHRLHVSGSVVAEVVRIDDDGGRCFEVLVFQNPNSYAMAEVVGRRKTLKGAKALAKRAAIRHIRDWTKQVEKQV